jgi:hypothetical protein
MTTPSRPAHQQLSEEEIYNILNHTSPALRHSNSGSHPNSPDAPRKSWQSDWTPSSTSSPDSTWSPDSTLSSDGSENLFRERQGVERLPRRKRLTQRPDFLGEAPGTPHGRGGSVSSNEYYAAVHMELSGNDGLICENGNTPSSSSSDECWECTARNEEIAILKAESKTQKVEIDRLNRALNDRMVYDLFH